jgi:hypothetical protein
MQSLIGFMANERIQSASTDYIVLPDQIKLTATE